MAFISSHIAGLALTLFFGVPIVGMLYYFVDEDSAHRRLGWVGPYLVYLLPLYFAILGAIGVVMTDPHTALFGIASALFSAFPAVGAWRKRRR